MKKINRPTTAPPPAYDGRKRWCRVCGEVLTVNREPFPAEWRGDWYCGVCWEELALGVIRIQTARLHSSGAGCPMEPDDGASPGQENAIRRMEDR